MVDVTSAVASARNYLQGIQHLLDNSLENLRLEEVELTEDEKHWLITLGYDVPGKPQTMSQMFGPNSNYLREYKLFRINSDDGKVEAMKIRNV
ncbi:MAG: hypothetical protein AAF716_14480 [Cyanobacteria bacterium P01_D01_bin.1]